MNDGCSGNAWSRLENHLLGSQRLNPPNNTNQDQQFFRSTESINATEASLHQQEADNFFRNSDIPPNPGMISAERTNFDGFNEFNSSFIRPEDDFSSFDETWGNAQASSPSIYEAEAPTIQDSTPSNSTNSMAYTAPHRPNFSLRPTSASDPPPENQIWEEAFRQAEALLSTSETNSSWEAAFDEVQAHINRVESDTHASQANNDTARQNEEEMITEGIIQRMGIDALLNDSSFRDYVLGMVRSNQISYFPPGQRGPILDQIEDAARVESLVKLYHEADLLLERFEQNSLDPNSPEYRLLYQYSQLKDITYSEYTEQISHATTTSIQHQPENNAESAGNDAIRIEMEGNLHDFGFEEQAWEQITASSPLRTTPTTQLRTRKASPNTR